MRLLPHKIKTYLSGGNRVLVFALSFLLLFSLGSYALAAALYHPSDNVTDPSCAPGSTDCYVDSTANVTIGSAVSGAGADQLLYTDDSGDLATSPDFSYDPTDGTFSLGLSGNPYLSIVTAGHPSFQFGDINAATEAKGIFDISAQSPLERGAGWVSNIKDAVSGSAYFSIERNTEGGGVYDNYYGFGDQDQDTGLALEIFDRASSHGSDQRYLSLGDVGGVFGGTRLALDDVAQTISLDAANGVTVSSLAGNGDGCVATDDTGLLSFTSCGGGGATLLDVLTDGSNNGGRSIVGTNFLSESSAHTSVLMNAGDFTLIGTDTNDNPYLRGISSGRSKGQLGFDSNGQLTYSPSSTQDPSFYAQGPEGQFFLGDDGVHGGGNNISIDDDAGNITLSTSRVVLTGLAGNGSGYVTVDNSGILSWSAGLSVSTDATLTGDGTSTPIGLNLSNANIWLGKQTFSTDTTVLGNVYSKGTTWISRADPNGEANEWNSVAYGNGMYVAVAQNGTDRVMTSPDGVTWSPISVGADTWKTITYGNGLFVAVALDGGVMTSPDGVTWTAGTNLSGGSGWNSVAYGKGVFVAVSSSGTDHVATSSDGINWTFQAGTSNKWESITYGNGMFVAVSQSGTVHDDVMTSPDGVTWSSGSTASAATYWQSVTYGNGLFVAVALFGDVMTSPDGITWTPETASVGNNWNSVTYGGGLFVAVSGSGTTSNDVMTSPDGITWSNRSVPTANFWGAVTYGNGMFVAVSQDGTTSNDIMTSGFPDTSTNQNNNIYQGGITVNGTLTLPDLSGASGLAALDTSGNISSVGIGPTLTGGVTGTPLNINLSNANTWLAAQTFATDTIVLGNVYSKGTVWTTRTGAPTTGWSAVTYGNGMYVAVTNNAVMTSPDGINWSSQTAATGDWASVTYGNGLFVAVGGNAVMTSPDGINWSNQTPGSSNNWTSVTYGNGVFVAVAGDSSGDVMTSSNGINWATHSAASASEWLAVTYGNGKFVAVAAGDTTTTNVMTSSDGATWVNGTLSPVTAYLSIAYANGRFVIGGLDRILSSTDGVTWSTAYLNSDGSIWDGFAYGNGLFVAVSSSVAGTDSVLTSPDGVTWTTRSIPTPANRWTSVAYGNGMFVSVASTGTTSNDIMTSGSPDTVSNQNNNIYQGGITVNGTIAFPSLVSCGGLQTNANGVASCTSDQNFKDIHSDFTAGLDAINQLHPKTYSWKAGTYLYDGGVNYSGFIAQDVQAAIPEGVSIGSTGQLQLNTTTVLAAAVNAIKDLDLKVEPLTSIDPTVSGSLASLIAQFLGSATNGLASLFVGTVHTDKLCVGSTCLDEAQIQQILSAAGNPSGTVSTPPASAPSTPPSSDDSSTDGTTAGASASTPPASSDTTPPASTDPSSVPAGDSTPPPASTPAAPAS